MEMMACIAIPLAIGIGILVLAIRALFSVSQVLRGNKRAGVGEWMSLLVLSFPLSSFFSVFGLFITFAIAILFVQRNRQVANPAIEPVSGKLVELVAFLRKAQSLGWSRERIVKRLQDAGWLDAEIERAFQFVENGENG